MPDPKKPAGVACCPDCKHLCEGCDSDALTCPRMLRAVLRKFSRWIHSEDVAEHMDLFALNDFGEACDEVVEKYLEELRNE